jgi:hypothetical protein
MCLRFVFLLITLVAAWLRLSQREETWRTAEILILRHQLTILQRRCPHRPNLNWADRALLATLLGVIPKARRRLARVMVGWPGAAQDRLLAGSPGTRPRRRLPARRDHDRALRSPGAADETRPASASPAPCAASSWTAC